MRVGFFSVSSKGKLWQTIHNERAACHWMGASRCSPVLQSLRWKSWSGSPPVWRGVSQQPCMPSLLFPSTSLFLSAATVANARTRQPPAARRRQLTEQSKGENPPTVFAVAGLSLCPWYLSQNSAINVRSASRLFRNLQLPSKTHGRRLSRRGKASMLI